MFAVSHCNSDHSPSRPVIGFKLSFIGGILQEIFYDEISEIYMPIFGKRPNREPDSRGDTLKSIVWVLPLRAVSY